MKLACLPENLPNARSSLAVVALTTLLSVLLGGCGRSALPAFFNDSDGGGGSGASGPGGGGTGGTTSSSSTSSSTTTGSGGSGDGACPALKTSGVVQVAGSVFHQLQPKLAPSSEDQQLVTVAMEWKVVEGPAPIPSELRHVSFKPWGLWPQGELAPSYLADFDGGVRFDVAAATGGRFALAFSDFGKPGSPQGAIFNANMVPTEGSIGQSVTLDPSADDILFVQYNDPAHLVAYGVMGIGPQTILRTVTKAGSTYVLGAPSLVACADGASADAVAFQNGWLLAISNAAPFMPDSCGPVAGTPTELQLAFVDDSGGASLGDVVKTVEAIVQVKVAPHPEGAWVAWTEMGIVPQVRVVRVDANAKIVMGPIFLTNMAVETDYLAAGNIGDMLLVAHAEPQDGGGHALLVNVIDEMGTVLTSSGLFAADQLTPGDLLGSPGGNAALLSWTESVGLQQRTKLMRLECDD